MSQQIKKFQKIDHFKIGFSDLKKNNNNNLKNIKFKNQIKTRMHTLHRTQGPQYSYPYSPDCTD